MSRKKDKTIPKSQQEIAFERIQRRELDEEIAARERREKLLARGQLGQQSLLSGSAAISASAQKPGLAIGQAPGVTKPPAPAGGIGTGGKPRVPGNRRLPALIGA